MKKGKVKDLISGILLFVVLPIITLVVSTVLEIGIFATLLIMAGVFVIGVFIISYISLQKDKANIKKQKNNGTWEFPIHHLLKKCAPNGIVNIDSEDRFLKVQGFVKEILVNNEIPNQLYDQYMSKEAIAGYFESMRASSQWPESALGQTLAISYDECTSAKAVAPLNVVTREKATLIANKYFKDYDLDAIMAEGKRIQRIKLEAELKNKKTAEQAAQDELLRYVKFHGREKPMAMYDDLYRDVQKELGILIDRYNTIAGNSDKMLKKEKSWGLAGGIAEAIAGPAVGVAAAIDVQKQNASAREFNEKWSTMTANSLGYLEKEIQGKEQRANYLINCYKKAQTLLVDDKNQEECFRQITFEQPTITVSDTGTATVEVHVVAKTYKIYDDRTARIDGSIAAYIFDGETKLGQAIMVLPKDGIGFRGCKLKGMALFCCEQGKQYRIEFAPHDLWAIEL